MPQHFKLGNPGISAISVDGVEHRVNEQNGLLEVHTVTPGLRAQLMHHAAVLVHDGETETAPGPAPTTTAAIAPQADPPPTATPEAPAPTAPEPPPPDATEGDPPSEDPTHERQVLFQQLDEAYGRHIDRRRSLGQLRQMWSDYLARQAETQAAVEQVQGA